MSPAARFILYSRPNCGLCDEMVLALGAVAQMHEHAIDIRNVDTEPVAKARYGHKIPVLLLDGTLVCHGRLDVPELHKALAILR